MVYWGSIADMSVLHHIQHSCQMTGLTRSVPNQASAWTTVPMRLRQGGRFHLFHKKFAQSANFLGKEIKVPRCRRRNTPLLEANGLFVRPPRKSCQVTFANNRHTIGIRTIYGYTRSGQASTFGCGCSHGRDWDHTCKREVNFEHDHDEHCHPGAGNRLSG